MKKIIFVTLFVTILISGVFGQQRAENSWMVGTWVRPGTDDVIVLNNNGTGNFLGTDIIFSITGGILYIFPVAGNSFMREFQIFRVNDSTVVFQRLDTRAVFRFNKR